MKLSKVELMMTRFLWLKNSRVCDSCNFEMCKRFVLSKNGAKLHKGKCAFVMAM